MRTSQAKERYWMLWQTPQTQVKRQKKGFEMSIRSFFLPKALDTGSR